MTVLLSRRQTGDGGTFGELFVNGKFFAFTLEPDEDRPSHPAIPVGVYKVIVTLSARFKRRLPLIVGVPGRTGIRIHPGNLESDTEGCILLGTSQTAHGIGNSRVACEKFQTVLEQALERGETVLLSVIDGPESVKAA